MYDLYSYVNYELGITLTVLDNTAEVEAMIEAFYVMSPHRTCSNVMAKLGQTAKDRIDKFPTKYLSKLPFKHLAYYLDAETRLKNYWTKVSGQPHYFITKNRFPLRHNKGFEDYRQFVLECEPSNLVYDLMPYELIGDFIYVENAACLNTDHLMKAT